MPDLFCSYIQYHQNILPMPHSQVDGIDKTCPGLSFNCDLVDNNFYIMNFIPVQLESVGDLRDLSVNSDFQVPLFTDLFKKFAVMSFPAFYSRSQYADGFILIVSKDKVYNLLFRIPYHLLPRYIRVCICTS